MLVRKTLKFSLAYAFVTAIYYLFDYVYMPWLAIKFGFAIFIPLYPSILLANFLGIFLYDIFKEDILFLELSSNWINGENGKFKKVRNFIQRSKKLTFIILSIWPSPIASYIFFRGDKKRENWEAFKTIALGSVFCTVFWGGGISLVVKLIKKIIILF